MIFPCILHVLKVAYFGLVFLNCSTEYSIQSLHILYAGYSLTQTIYGPLSKVNLLVKEPISSSLAPIMRILVFHLKCFIHFHIDKFVGNCALALGI